MSYSKFRNTTSATVSPLYARSILPEDRTPQAKRIELLKKQNLNCTTCNHICNKKIICKLKSKKVSKHNICDFYGIEVLK